ncbi:cytochrome c oxidase subunit 2A [Exiguobacterium sp. PBE]|nr:cytochrome c oxidase subunit 2A [Exiguobacterium sp. SRB7LM]QLQ23426.1 MAG: cytochrome c oxidase subunit 2A [Paracoccaceae bacterium]QPI69216.1 cytochrome c oxidase subunit 2A [Exiguobacterium sp. PBE]QUP88664.1 cytochrome c oxidase subunit 2A [Exiguobacterium sp. PFWT01]
MKVEKQAKGVLHVEHKDGQEPNLKGTFTSVMIVAGVIIAMWSSVFYLFVTR